MATVFFQKVNAHSAHFHPLRATMKLIYSAHCAGRKLSIVIDSRFAVHLLVPNFGKGLRRVVTPSTKRTLQPLSEVDEGAASIFFWLYTSLPIPP